MKIYISPMAGITDYAYRQIMSKFTPDLVFAEMVNAHLMNLDDKTTITQLLKCDNFETTGAQIFGYDKDELVNAFLKVESLGFKKVSISPSSKLSFSFANSTLNAGKPLYPIFFENRTQAEADVFVISPNSLAFASSTTCLFEIINSAMVRSVSVKASIELFILYNTLIQHTLFNG